MALCRTDRGRACARMPADPGPALDRRVLPRIGSARIRRARVGVLDQSDHPDRSIPFVIGVSRRGDTRGAVVRCDPSASDTNSR